MDKNAAYTHATDAELEAQFNERNNNLRKNFGQLVDKIDAAANKTQDYLNAELQDGDGASNSQTNTSTMASSDQSSSIFKGPSSASTTTTATTTSHMDYMDRKAMDSIRDDIRAMHSLNPEEFELVAPKMDETFGHNALV